MTRAVFLLVLLAPILIITQGCTSSGPPTDLVIRNDHRGLVQWYEQEGVRLRSKTDDCRQKIHQYEDPLFQPAPKETKQQLITECNSIIKHYVNAADEAEVLARYHRQKESGREQ